MFERLRAFRGLSRPRRFRTRMLLGMLAVALVPLVVFTAVVAADLGAVSKSTVEDTQTAIVQDQEQRQAGEVADRALTFDVRLGSIASEVRQLRDFTEQALDHPPAGAASSLGFLADHGAWFASSSDTSLIVGGSSPLVHGGELNPAARTAPLA